MSDRWLLRFAVCAILAFSSNAIGDDDDDSKAAADQQVAVLALNDEQQRAVGIVVAHPLVAKAPGRIEAFGQVLDPSLLVSDAGEKSAADAAERSSSAELERLRSLFSGGAGASLRSLEAAQSEAAKARSEAATATARFELHWAPLAAMPAAAREKLLEASASGRSLLVRADLPGVHGLGLLPAAAVLDVDGILVPGRILGALRQASEVQGVGVLIEVQNAPLGLGPGARIPVALLSPDRAGVLLPRDAVLYDENGAYVYKQSAKKAGDGKNSYVSVKVSLLLPEGDSWLVEGVDDDDNVVVRGAGVLWSLQGLGSHAVDDD